ncbi:thioredoxin-disulfide reductase [bacterium]|nr:thioredoxin-disulfide reductase [bacterium]
MKDIIIIGAGPAGITAGIYAARAGKSALILEGECFGGQIVTAPLVENYPSVKIIKGYELASNMVEQALELGVEMEMDRVHDIIRNEDGIITVFGENEKYSARAVIIAGGAKNKKMGLPREEALLGSGISYCALCDGAFFRNKEVAVVGGGNSALEEAIFLTSYCPKVYLIHRRAEFRAEQKLVEEFTAKPNAILVLDSEITELLGDKKLEGVKVRNKVSGAITELKFEGLFVAIGKVPDNGYLASKLALDESGYIIATEDCKTSIEGVFVAGDCRTKTVRQLTTATADGAVASVAACVYCNK